MLIILVQAVTKIYFDQCLTCILVISLKNFTYVSHVSDKRFLNIKTENILYAGIYI